MGSFEPLVLQALRDNLPDSYSIIPNLQIKQAGHNALEYDFVVLAPHAVFVLEAKEWYGRLTGDDTEWLINQKPRKCPMWLVDLKCKVLKSELGGIGQHVWIEPLLVYPDGTQNNLSGRWRVSAASLSESIAFLRAPARLQRTSNVAQYHPAIIKQFEGAAGQRRRDSRRRIGSYEVLEVVYEDSESGEYIGRRALLSDDQTRYRIRTWKLEPGLSPQERERRRQIISRPTEAVAKVGRHPNLLPVLQFDFVDDDNEFFEVTEWSDFGTLHGYLSNDEQEHLTLRERLLIAEGVAAALEAVHAHDVVHRDICPESIVIDFEHKPLLTDFDRAHIKSRQTVFADTERQKNAAFVPPELKDPKDYEFAAASDLYSFGSLLYYLIVGNTPFSDPDQAIAAKGRPAKLPSQAQDGLELGFDNLVLDLLNIDFRERPTTTQTSERLRKLIHNGSSAKSKVASTTSKRNDQTKFEVGATIDNVYRIEAELGSGAFSNVYKVYHLDHLETYAMKLLAKSTDADIILHEYNQVGKDLPRHPNIARVIWMARLAPPDNRPFILSEFIDGEPLDPYCSGDKQLAWSDIRSIGEQLLDALTAMHPKTDILDGLLKRMSGKSVTGEEWEELQRQKARVAEGILHRDIKPANILLELPSHRPKLIDFNIASKLGAAEGRGGTPRYWAPDRGRPEWHANMDLFSLGVVLYELVTHRHPFQQDNPDAGAPYDPRELCTDLNLSRELAEFLLKAVAPAGPDRFQTATDMKAAWLAIPRMRAAAQPPVAAVQGAYPGLVVGEEEKNRKNYNPYVGRLLTLYSQASRSNAGTRGLDDIARLTYVSTSLDEHLERRSV